MPKLIILRGPSGSGKTYVLDQVKKKLTRQKIACALIDNDLISFGFTVNSLKGTGQTMIKNVCCLVKNFLDAGLNVLTVGALSDEKMVKKIATIAHRKKIPCRIFRIDINYRDAIKRIKHRETGHKSNQARYNIYQDKNLPEIDWHQHIEKYQQQNIDDLIIDYRQDIAKIIIKEITS